MGGGPRSEGMCGPRSEGQASTSIERLNRSLWSEGPTASAGAHSLSLLSIDSLLRYADRDTSRVAARAGWLDAEKIMLPEQAAPRRAAATQTRRSRRSAC
jgi:hypothetical protein